MRLVDLQLVWLVALFVFAKKENPAHFRACVLVRGVKQHLESTCFINAKGLGSS